MNTSSEPSASPRPFPWVPVLVMLALVAGVVGIASFSGTPPKGDEAPPVAWSWWRPFTWSSGVSSIELARYLTERDLEMFQARVGAFAALSALAYLAVYFFGAPIFEWVRSWVANRFRLSATTQRDLAVAAFTVACGLVAVIIFTVPAFKYARVCSIILLAGSGFPFLVKVLPGISHEDKELRMSGTRDMKAILAVLAVVLVAFQILNGGIGGLTVNPPSASAK